MKFAVLIIFIAAAVITPTGDMMTQAIFAAPMLLLYVLSIGIAWIVGPKRGSEAVVPGETKLRLVIGAMVLDQARKHRRA